METEITKICTWSQMTETVLTDNGITVIGAEEGVELKVKDKSSISESLKTALENQVKSLHENIKGMEIYDIALFKEGEEIHNLNTAVRVTIPIPEGFGKNLVVYHEEQEGKLEDMKAAVNDNGTVSFTASRFSPYILADLGENGGIPAEKPERTREIQVTGMGGTQVTEPERIQATQGVEPEEIPALQVMGRMCLALTEGRGEWS